MAYAGNDTQSQLIAVAPSGEHLGAIMRCDVEAPPYEELVNFPRAKDKDEIRCVMCGLPPGVACVIPRQNKDVCKDCDKSTWLHAGTGVYFKWCKGCKKFLRLGSFSEKLDAAKCDRCRERGRQSYLVKKGKDGGVEICVVGGRSRSNSCSSTNSDFASELTSTMSLVSAAAALAAQCAPSSARARSRLSMGSCSPGHDEYGHEAAEHEYGHSLPYEATWADDAQDTLLSAHAVVAFSGRSRSNSIASPAPEDSSVVIDDFSADGTAQKLSSVFGKPLCELQRCAAPAVAHGAAAATTVREGSVGSAFRGTLYELACIHQRIITLEEHASRVKVLEATIEAQDGSLKGLAKDCEALRGDLAAARDEAATLRGALHAAPGSEASSEPNSEPSSEPCSEPNSEPNSEPSSEEAMGEEEEAAEESSGEGLAALSDVATEALACALERAHKRPRLVSLGE
jgi:outer membrane murein-binding lipoprotein Lpp